MSNGKKFNNSGILFRNHDKSKETDRDFRGECTVDGVSYWMSAWLKEGRKGKFLSFSFKPKEPPKEQSAGVPFNDEVPFAPEFRA